ncbi:MAG: hypothetical protein LC687_07290 [Actinobacteria bacterium]|nr:hypothetical protein [Actinomycetota bacterium]
MARYATVNDIINRVALEVGLDEETFPYDSSNSVFKQLGGLLNSAGEELIELHPWQAMVKSYQIVTQSTDSGEYDLPDDYAYMIDQTHWDRTNDVPLIGPLSGQIWTYLQGRDLVNQTIYASFRLLDGKFNIFPNPPPAGIDLNFEYMSRDWVRDVATGQQYDRIQAGDNYVLFEPILIVKFLKAKFLESKGFDASAARLEFSNMFNSRTGKDTGGDILSASGQHNRYPYLTPYGNTGDTNFGVP